MTDLIGLEGDLWHAHAGASTLQAVPAEPAPLVAHGRYRIVRFLGQGANKQVFLAEDVELGRQVAIAFIRRAAADHATLVRVRRELRAMASLGDHPNIVTIHDVGEEDGRTFIVSQYADGGSLADHLERAPGRRLAVTEVLSIAVQIAEALRYAHARGIVHRDLKPGNVFYTERGAALLGDFGMAVAGSDLRITAEDAFVGTAPYMAPEQARGHPVDARSDLYSLGVMLFELLCGRLPFTGSDPFAIVAQAAHSPRPSVRSLCLGVPQALDALVQRLIAARPEDRPASADDVLRELRSLGPASAATVVPRPPLAAVPLPPPLIAAGRSPFVGRAAALAVLERCWRAVRAGQPNAVFIRGNAGIGKTRLCAQFAHSAHRTGIVVYGRCEEEALAPYGPFIQAVRHYAAHRPDLPERLALPAGFELARLGWPAPDAAQQLQASRAGGDRALERHQLFDAAAALVKAMASEAPLLVVFDDLHWADMPTLRMLRHMIRYVDDRVLLIGAMRDDEPRRNEEREQALAELERESVVEVLDLDGLDEHETEALVRARSNLRADDQVVGRLRARTGGNPFYIEETLRAAGDLDDLRDDLQSDRASRRNVPKGIEALLARRLAGLAPETREALDAAAVIGREFDLGLLAAMLGRDVLVVADTLEEAIDQGLITEVPAFVDRFAFCHALIRLYLYRRQPAARRIARHLRCAEMLEQRYAVSGAHAAELAHHFAAGAHAGGAGKALHYALAAAEWASEALAYEDAVFQQERSLVLLQGAGPEQDPLRCDLLLSRGRALLRLGDRERARDSFGRAADVARRLGDATRFARAALGYGRRYYDPGVVDSTLVALLEEALRRLGHGDSGARARTLAGLAEALAFRESPERLRRRSGEALAMARRVRAQDPGAYAVALGAHHTASLHIKFLDERLDLSEQLLAMVGERPSEHRADALNWRLYDLFEAGEIDEAAERHAELKAVADRLRQPLYRHFAAAWSAKWAEMEGDFPAAEHQAEISRRYAHEAHMPYAESNYAGQRFGLLRDQGRLDELPDEARAHIGDRPRLPVWRAGLICAWLDAGLEARARAEFEELARDDFAGVPEDFFWLGATCLLAEACGKLADREGADTLYRLLEPYAERNAQIGLALSVGVVQRFLGRLSTTLGRLRAAEEHFAEALERSEAMHASAAIAHIRCEYAELLLARDGPGDRALAAEHLHAAQRSAERLGMQPVARRAAQLERAP